MPKFQVQVCGLKPRVVGKPSRGRKFSKARAYMILQLPDDGAQYSSFELVSYFFRQSDDKRHFRKNCDAFEKRIHRLLKNSSKNLTPQLLKDMQDNDGPVRLTKEEWLSVIPDEIYNELVSLEAELIELQFKSPANAVFFCDFDTYELSFEIPQEPAANSTKRPLSGSSTSISGNTQHYYNVNRQKNRPTGFWVGLLVAALVLFGLLVLITSNPSAENGTMEVMETHEYFETHGVNFLPERDMPDPHDYFQELWESGQLEPAEPMVFRPPINFEGVES